MNMERKNVEPKAIIVIDKIAKASEMNELTKCFEGDVIITKRLILDKSVDVACNVHVMGGIARKTPITEADININGDLYCYGDIHCNNINVSGCFYAEKLIYSKNIKVGGNFLCDSKIDAFGCDVIVAGDFECHGITARRVEYFGQISLKGSISVSGGIKSYS